MLQDIVIKGAKEHNLKNIDLTIPRNKLVVITGLSGSGKSSLAFDTIYAEGQRRYVESLSNYARQFLQQMQKPEVEHIEGLSPAIAIDQKSTSRNPRSTVGTITEIYDYLRLLFAHIGKPHCFKCGKPISKQSSSQIINEILSLPEETKLEISAPVVKAQKGEFKNVLESIRKDGFVRARIDGEIKYIEEPISLNKNTKHTIEIVIDRLKVKSESKSRIADSLEIALKAGKGIVNILTDQGEKLYSEHFACMDCGINMEEISPRMFSFNAPFGACPSCNGLGAKLEFSPELVFPDKNVPLRYASMILNLNNTYFSRMVVAVGKKYGFTLDTLVKDLTEKQLQIILYGSGKEKFDFNWQLGKSGTSKFSGDLYFSNEYEGVIGNLTRRYMQTNSENMRFSMRRYMIDKECSECNGLRLKKEILAILVHGYNIGQVTKMDIESAIQFFQELHLTEHELQIASELIKEIKLRLNFLQNVGLGYLTLNRKAGTLSGGESQRIRLATQIGSGLVGVLYVLDEPSIGLHQRDNKQLIKTLEKLRDLGNTVIVVEHDEETIRSADHIIDLGPGAGKYGGDLVFEGTIKELIASNDSNTADYLTGKRKIELINRKRIKNYKYIEVVKASENNLKNVTVKFPLSKMICVTGVSGSGKSSLVNEVLYKAVAKKINKSKIPPGKHESIKGIKYIDKVIIINQDPIGKTPRSNPATYTGVFDHIRSLFSSTKESQKRGYKQGRFSFNVKGGRCESCQGDGLKKIEMAFLPDVYVSCEACKGKRYNSETLEITYKGLNIADILGLSVAEAYDFFHNIPKIKRILQTLMDVGLSYIHLGQSSTTLSGGEAQRIKLSSELSKRSTGKTLYILDEPTTGLHFADVELLIRVLDRLVSKGNTIVVIEHNVDVIRNADHIIDIGPEGGNSGGQIVAFGTVEELKKSIDSYTGCFL